MVSVLTISGSQDSRAIMNDCCVGKYNTALASITRRQVIEYRQLNLSFVTATKLQFVSTAIKLGLTWRVSCLTTQGKKYD